MDREGKASKRLKVFTPYHLASLQGPTTRHPGGRFHELSREHFPWLKQKLAPYKRLQVLLSNCTERKKILSVKGSSNKKNCISSGKAQHFMIMTTLQGRINDLIR